MNNSPKISVIIPARCRLATLETLLAKLTSQSLPTEQFEIIIVDNGCPESIEGLATQAPNLRVTKEHDIRSSYAARNAGIRAALAPLFAFIDADCEPDSSWLEAGLAALAKNPNAVYAGRIKIKTAAQNAFHRFDSQFFLQQEANVRERGVATTANLFAPALAFERAGLFRERMRSSGDFAWTALVQTVGFQLNYLPEAIVSHRSRGFAALTRKAFRLGVGKGQWWRTASNKSRGKIHRGLPTNRGFDQLLVYSLVYVAAGIGFIYGVLTLDDRNGEKNPA